MLDFLREAHSGWRYLVILATLLVALYFIFALVSKRTAAKQERIVLAAWAGVVDMQLLLGLILLVYYLVDGRYYAQLTGHWLLGFVTVFIAHIPTLYKRLNGQPSDTVRRAMGVGLPLVAFASVYFGVLALGYGLFERSGG
jgi:hypothetical protein